MASFQEMTQLSPTMTEGTIVNWLKKEGDSISPGEIIAEVETDKAVMEMEAYDSGYLLAILAEPGVKVAVGLPIAIIGKKDENIEALIQQGKEKLKSASSSSTPKPQPPPKDITQTKKEPEPIPEKSIQTPTSPTKEEKKFESVTKQPNTGRILASPLARKIAKEKNVDLKFIQGTGPGGRILERDVYSYLERKPSSALGPSNYKSSLSYLPFGNKIDQIEIPVSSMRKVIAERLSHSKQSIPHYYLNVELNAEPLVKFREKLNQGIQSLVDNQSDLNIKISFNDIIVKSCALALEKHPLVNASWRGDTIYFHPTVDIGIAVSLPDGLITPVIRNATEYSLVGLSREIAELVDKARKRKLKPEEYSGSSFTISNLGMYGISFFTAIINEPESAILAVGGIEDKPVIQNGIVVPGKTLSLTLSCDHRVIDGAEGAKFLKTLKSILEFPELLS